MIDFSNWSDPWFNPSLQFAVHCKSNKEAELLCDILNRFGKRRANLIPYDKDHTGFREDDKFHYYTNDGFLVTKEFCNTNSYTIYEFEEATEGLITQKTSLIDWLI